MTLTTSQGTTTDVRTFELFVDGRWTGAADGATFDVLSPIDGSVYARVPAGSRVDMATAVAAAQRAQPAWAATAPGAKQAMFLRAAALVEERAGELVAALAEETGAGYGFSMYQVTWSAQLLRLAAGWVYENRGRLLPTDHPHTVAYAERKPLGVVASFTPWNGANLLAWRSVVVPLGRV